MSLPPSVVRPLTAEELRPALIHPVIDRLHYQLLDFSLLCPPKPMLDDTTKFQIKNAAGKPIAVVLCSAPASPGMVARSMAKAKAAKQTLGSELGHLILNPLCEGTMDGLSYCVLPYCQPLASSKLEWFIQRSLISTDLFNLLHRLTEITCCKVKPQEIQPTFAEPLRYLLSLNNIPRSVRLAAIEALQRLEREQWSPRYVLMHNDLWKGNILLAPTPADTPPKAWSDRFILIDWAGSETKGYAIYDLIRLAQSMKLKPASLHQQILAHCQVLGCDLEDAKSYLLTALGHLAMTLEYFPLEQFLDVTKSCLDTLDRACLSRVNKGLTRI